MSSAGDEPEQLGRIISRILKAARGAAGSPDLERVWRDAVGAEVSRHTRITGFKRGVLEVEVDGPGWLSELSVYYREPILASLRALPEFSGLASIVFRIGCFGNSAAQPS